MAIQPDELAAVITQHIDKELPDGLEKANPLWNYIMKDKNGAKYVGGGTYLQFPIKLLKNISSAFISGTNAITDTSPSTQIQYGVLQWKWAYFAVNFTLEDFTVAGGKEQVVDFIKSKKDGALADFYRALSVATYGSDSTPGNELAFNGLADIVADSGIGYAGLSDTDYTDGDSPYLPYISTDTIFDYPAISDLITQSRARSQTAGGSGEMMGLMSPYLYNKLYSILDGHREYSQVYYKKVYAGFQTVNVNGVDMYMDVDSPGSADGTTADNYLYIIPKDVLSFNHKFGLKEKSPMDGGAKIPNQPLITIQKYLAGNLVCNNRRRISVCKTFV